MNPTKKVHPIAEMLISGNTKCVVHLPRDHRRRRVRKFPRQQITPRRAHHLRERQAHQRIPRQYRRGFTERDMHRRTPAPQVIVIHRRQIIVNQTKRVDHLNCGTRRQRIFDTPAHRERRRSSQRRTKPLATPQQRIPHRAIQR